jgi:hypothetical protein
MAIPGDVSKEADVKDHIQKSSIRGGDVLVNCTGILGGKSILEYDVESFNH